MIAVILAAGLSTRFGSMKLLEKINQKSMVLHVTDLVNNLDFEQKIIVYSDDAVLNEIQLHYKNASHFAFIYNSQAHKGLSTSIKAAMDQLNTTKEKDGIMFFVADQPFIDTATVEKLFEAFYEDKGSIIVPVYGQNRGNPVLFSVKWIEELKNLEGDVGGRVIIRENLEEVWEVSILDPLIGKDIDTKEEYNTLLNE